MVGPPSEDNKFRRRFFYFPSNPRRQKMTKGDPANILVFCIIIAFVSFVVYVAVQSRIEEKKNKSKEEDKK